MEYCFLQEHTIDLNNCWELQMVQEFLLKHGLELDRDVEYTMVLLDGEKIAASGSFCGRILKCIAVDENYQGRGIANKVVSHLLSEEYRKGNTHLFIYTKPENYRLFHDMGFYRIAEVPSKVVLLENTPFGIRRYVDEVRRKRVEGMRVSSIVMNCNPFTLGHQYLIEKASAESDIVHIFLVWEDRSSFPTHIRYHLLKEGTSHLKNVVIHKGMDYVISLATFPSYFIKEYNDVVKTHALLDLKIYCDYIAPALGINRRYIGEEPYCPVTRVYNDVMKEVLPGNGVQVLEIPRLEAGSNAVSASIVRKYLQEDEFDKIRQLVPETTYKFLLSDEANEIIKKIQYRDDRH
jgi:[citrate (pro-3S)-lyase] ligase